MAPSVVDFVGNRIQIGDTLAYPVRRRSDMALKKAVVCETPTAAGVAALKENGQRVVIRVPERCIVINRLEKV
jgi:hypothetical protein